MGGLAAFGDLTTDPKMLIGKNASGMLGTNIDPSCMNKPFIESTAPARGVLFTRVMGTGCGPTTQMPQPKTVGEAQMPLSQDLLNCLTDWVNAQLPQASPDEDLGGGV